MKYPEGQSKRITQIAKFMQSKIHIWLIMRYHIEEIMKLYDIQITEITKFVVSNDFLVPIFTTMGSGGVTLEHLI